METQENVLLLTLEGFIIITNNCSSGRSNEIYRSQPPSVSSYNGTSVFWLACINILEDRSAATVVELEESKKSSSTWNIKKQTRSPT